MSEELLVSGRYLVPMDGTVREDAAVVVRDGVIAAVGDRTELEAAYPGARRLHTPEGIVLPGLVNVHTHAAMSCFRGLADDLELMEWLERHIFPAEAELTPEIVYQASLLSFCEMIRSGTTSCCDMYLFSREVARAAEEVGIRAWIGEVLYDFPSPCYGPLAKGYDYVRDLAVSYQGHPRITVTVDPHAVYTCSPELLRRAHELACDLDAIYVIHLAETEGETAACRERYGATPVRHLERLGVLDQRLLAGHCVVLDDDEIALLAGRGGAVAHCLESNMKLGSGLAPVPELLEAGVAVGLGTDGPASNNDQDLFGEMGNVARVHKGFRRDPTVLPAARVLQLATDGGAACLRMTGRLGRLAVGAAADIVVVDADAPHLTPLYDRVSHLVYCATGPDVRHTVVDGRVVMEDRRITTVDERAAVSRMRELAGRLRPLMGGAPSRGTGEHG